MKGEDDGQDNTITYFYSSLINGDEINKIMFCLKNDWSLCSFDRDIEDIRLLL